MVITHDNPTIEKARDMANLIDGKDLLWIWRTFIFRWPIYLLSVILFLSFGYIYNYKKIEIYNSNQDSLKISFYFEQ